MRHRKTSIACFLLYTETKNKTKMKRVTSEEGVGRMGVGRRR
jgi:hypothetical protein